MRRAKLNLVSLGTVQTKPCSPTHCRITDLMTHLWGISKAVAEAKVAAAEAKVAAAEATFTFNCVHSSHVSSVVFSPDGLKIAAAYSTEILLFDVQKQEVIGSLCGHSRYFDCCFLLLHVFKRVMCADY